MGTWNGRGSLSVATHRIVESADSPGRRTRAGASAVFFPLRLLPSRTPGPGLCVQLWDSGISRVFCIHLLLSLTHLYEHSSLKYFLILQLCRLDVLTVQLTGIKVFLKSLCLFRERKELCIGESHDSNMISVQAGKREIVGKY